MTHYIAVPDQKELAKFIANHSFVAYNAFFDRLSHNIDFNKVGKLENWRKDTQNIVPDTISEWKYKNQDLINEFENERKGNKVKPRWWTNKAGYKRKLRKCITDAIKEVNQMAINRSTVFTPKTFPGQRSMSKSHMPLKGKSHETHGNINRSKVFTPDKFPGYGCISGKHGVVPTGPTKGLRNAEGRLGAGTKAFGMGKQGPRPIGSGKKTQAGHGKMPQGAGKGGPKTKLG